MAGKQLKRFRVVLAILFFFSTFMVLVDYINLVPRPLIQGILFFQFVPSVLKFLEFTGLGVIGFLLILLITKLFGRIYCSAVCPLGILQDIFIHIAQLVKRRRLNRYHYHHPPGWLRYGILILTTLFLLAGSSFMLLLLDPYSNFARIQSNLTRPILMGIQNLIAIVLGWFHSYAVSRVPLTGFNWVAGFLSLAFLIFIGWTSWTRGRWFCNYVCPVGTLLGLTGRKSFFRIQLNRVSCTNCKACELNCKAECIDIEHFTIDHDRCV
ncbi:MAG: 4Fe-4S binding protein, partial [Bacteroidales bacterium]|nr:4Fe-4S binding protein [Bacteroidales bacterium]